MQGKIRKRKKGGGRKFADGRISRIRFIRSARKWFTYKYSVEDFLKQTGVSRQSYYRFLYKNELLHGEIKESRKRLILGEKENRKQLFAWLKKNPDKYIIDYYLRNIEFKLPEITNHPINVSNNHIHRG